VENHQDLSRSIPPPSLPPWEMLEGSRLLARAPAKLNLSLHITATRPDGYHELDSLVAKITLYDELVFTSLPDGRLELACDCPAAGATEKNLALRAARLLQEYVSRTNPAGVWPGAHIELRKRIAVGAGLGGGSSDAAAALVGLNRLWQSGLSNTELAAMAGQLGSDVSLFLAGPASRMRGRGEILTPVTLKPFWAILICPPLHCSTAQVYAAYDRLAAKPGEPLDVGQLAAHPVEQWPGLLKNDLRAPAALICPQITEWSAHLRKSVGQDILMTGSGSGIFALMPNFLTALAALNNLNNELSDYAHLVTLSDW
jgi:4-diphosphocytidyl-2-C-methyl-D-erythritol kinase